MNRFICVGLVCLSIAALTACSSTGTGSAESGDVETSGVESSAPETYDTNMISNENSADSEYEIDDMLPRPSDDTFVISVEEAEAIMNKNADANNDEE